MTVTLDLNTSSADPHIRRTLNDISLSVAKCKKIVVVTGAGISCSCGIPDFRSSDGLYALVKQRYPDTVLKGRDLFEASLFRDAKSTAVFYTFISQLKNSIDSASPSPTHRFIKTLDTKGKLLRSYTQNIDGFEEQAGLLGSSSQDAKADGRGKQKVKTRDVRNIQLHGDIHRVRCTACSAEYPCTQEHLKYFNEGMPPSCSDCLTRSNARAARSARPIKVGSLRPAIVLYGEPHPLGDEIGNMQTSDLARKPDMLIIMGTSLKVHGLKKLIKDFARTVHDSVPSNGIGNSSRRRRWAGKVIFVNKTPPPAEWSNIIDYHIAGETDEWSAKAISDWKRLRPADWEIQQTLVASDGEVTVSSPIKVAKETGAHLKAKRKGKASAVENRQPSPRDAVPSAVDISRKFPVPSSPGKRRQQAEHYNDLEASPPKRRTCSIKRAMADSERKTLFTESTNLHD
ncbi:hypothetical protein AX14_002477 [Amanita brunnescens Koide BX004]|nr:hypothetical protein AX14_002477 [Amanita brunnescens Koide BX004]